MSSVVWRGAGGLPTTAPQTAGNPDGRRSKSTLANTSSQTSPSTGIGSSSPATEVKRKGFLSRWVLTAALILGAAAALVLVTQTVKGAFSGTDSALSSVTASLGGSATKSDPSIPPTQHDVVEADASMADDVESDGAGDTNEEVLWGDAVNLPLEKRLYLAWFRAYGLHLKLLPPQTVDISPSSFHDWAALLLRPPSPLPSPASESGPATASSAHQAAGNGTRSTNARQPPAARAPVLGKNKSSTDGGSRRRAQADMWAATAGASTSGGTQWGSSQRLAAYRPPLAPHLQDCAALHSFQLRAESRGANGEMPWWNEASNCSDYAPDPPWVRGTNAANLAMTRVVQRDLWAHQFPSGDCSSARIAIFTWPPRKTNGLGSQLHILSHALDLALEHNRVMVPLFGSFGHGDHKACRALGHGASFSCYFHPVASPACERRAFREASSALAAMERAGAAASVEKLEQFLSSDAMTVMLPPYGRWLKYAEADIAWRWGMPWQQRLESVDYAIPKGPEATMFNGRFSRVHWWRSQSIRFILRFPSPYLCHISNQARHRAFGGLLAKRLVDDYRQRQHIVEAMNAERARTTANTSGGGVKEVEGNEAKTISKESLLIEEVWPVQGEAGSGRHVEAKVKPAVDAVGAVEEVVRSGDRQGETSGEDSSSDPMVASKWPMEYKQLVAGAADGSSAWSCVPMRVVKDDRGHEVARYVIPPVPLIPRPIVSVHVRQGDKASEMRLLPFDAYMLAAHRLRAHQPFLKYVWLSTEMQSVVDAVPNFKDWSFMFSHIPRQQGNMTMGDYESMVGKSALLGTSFINLLISSECDYFVGVLGSNWNRLINELRSTNGRLYASYVSLNQGQY